MFIIYLAIRNNNIIIIIVSELKIKIFISGFFKIYLYKNLRQEVNRVFEFCWRQPMTVMYIIIKNMKITISTNHNNLQ